ncbi:MAG: cytochrome c oxidase assembly protein [Trebonia sp.]
MQAAQAEAAHARSPRRRPTHKRFRHWPAIAAVVIGILAAALPELVAGGHLFAETIQFAAAAMVVPALAALGTPWVPRFARLSLPGAAAVGVVFIGVCLAWRVPSALDALARHPVLRVPELVTLLVAGLALWLQLVGSPSSPVRLTRPQRAAVAAIPMWSVWVVAYVLGFANHAVVSGYDVSGSLGTVTDQEITVILTWVISAACFIPVIAVTLLTWLRDSGGPGPGTAKEQRSAQQGTLVVRGWGRAPR